MSKTIAAIDRLMDGIVKVDETGCWEWHHSMTRPGYGRIRSNGTAWLAHRFSYTELVGPIPDGLEIDHLCRNRACVNPDHLEPVPQHINWQRGESPSQIHAQKESCDRGHPLDGENLIRLKSRPTWRRCRTCHNANKRALRQAGRIK